MTLWETSWLLIYQWCAFVIINTSIFLTIILIIINSTWVLREFGGENALAIVLSFPLCSDTWIISSSRTTSFTIFLITLSHFRGRWIWIIMFISFENRVDWFQFNLHSLKLLNLLSLLKFFSQFSRNLFTIYGILLIDWWLGSVLFFLSTSWSSFSNRCRLFPRRNTTTFGWLSFSLCGLNILNNDRWLYLNWSRSRQLFCRRNMSSCRFMFVLDARWFIIMCKQLRRVIFDFNTSTARS